MCMDGCVGQLVWTLLQAVSTMTAIIPDLHLGTIHQNTIIMTFPTVPEVVLQHCRGFLLGHHVAAD